MKTCDWSNSGATENKFTRKIVENKKYDIKIVEFVNEHIMQSLPFVDKYQYKI